MKLHRIPLIIIAMSLIAMSAVTYLAEFGTEYSAQADLSSLNQTQAYLDNQTQLAEGLRGRVENISVDSAGDVLLLPYNLIRAGWSMGKLMFGSWKTVEFLISDSSGAIDDAGLGFGVSAQITGLIIACIIIVLVSTLVYAFFKWKFES